MSFIESMTPKRGRLAKSDLSPVAAALAQPLPADLADAMAGVETAMSIVEVANGKLSEAQSARAKQAVDEQLRKAEAALRRANVQRDIAERIGADAGDVPDDDEIAGLERDAAIARAKAADFTPNIAAWTEELHRRQLMLGAAIDAARATLAPFERTLREAVAQQAQMAADLLAEAQAVDSYRRGLGDVAYPTSLQVSPGGDSFTGIGRAPAPQALRDAYSELIRREQRAKRLS